MAVVDLLQLPAALPPYAPVIGLDLDRKARHEISLNEGKFKAEVMASEYDEDKDKPKSQSYTRYLEEPITLPS